MSTSEKPSAPRPKGHSLHPAGDTISSPKHQPTPTTSLFFAEWTFTMTDALVLLLTTALAIIVRCHNLSTPNQVVFDEVHFGKFAGKYINGTYFYDLHPPLAKMMFAAAGKLAGYDGVFDFKSIGLEYEAAGVPYVGMRLMPALLGVVTVPAAYVTARACGYLWDTGLLAALLVCFENGLVTQSRLILLDSPLVFFTALSLTCWSMFWTKQGKPFSVGWWSWLVITGCMMGCAASCKWVGLFLFPAIGLSTIGDLWEKIADRRISPAKWFAHFFARAIGLLAVPLAVYLFWFQVHFQVLSKTGDAAPMMTPEFQATLKGGLDVTTDRDVYYGSEIRIRHTNSRSGYLHSHHHPWKHEKGSGQQQVTVYGYADPNNIWVVYPALNKTVDETDGPKKVQGGDIIRLRHKGTGKFLHSHDKKPALSNDDNKFEISGYGFPGFNGDANDNFRIDILSGDKQSPGSDKNVQAIYSRFRIVHNRLNCVLYNSRQKLPEWAFGQIEVNCMRNSMPRMTTWHVEYAHHPNITADVPKATYRPLTMLQKIWEYNKHMAESNESLTGDHPFAARPQHWPWLRRGTAYWGGRGKFIYQLGNPIVWWCSLAACLLFLAVRPVLFLLDKRRIHPTLGGQRNKYLSGAGFFTVAWLCHYVPFYLMGRELFVHHYFPALWMAIMVFAFTVDLVSARMPKIVRWSMYVAVLAAVLYAFQVFSFITYAGVWDKETCLKSKWLKTWDFDCEHAIGGIRATDPPPPPKTEAAADAAAAPEDTENLQQEEDVQEPENAEVVVADDGEAVPPVVEQKPQDNTEQKPLENAEAKDSGDLTNETVAGGQIGEPAVVVKKETESVAAAAVPVHVEPKFESVHEDEATELESIANNVEAAEKHDEL